MQRKCLDYSFILPVQKALGFSIITIFQRTVKSLKLLKKIQIEKNNKRKVLYISLKMA